MLKAIELIVVVVLLVFSFFAGVKYSNSVKEHASWLFEAKEEEVELPDLSNEGVEEGGVVIEEDANSRATNQAPAQEAEPMDEIGSGSTTQQPAAAQSGGK